MRRGQDRAWIRRLDRYGSLEALEAHWRTEDAWKHDPQVITNQVLAVSSSKGASADDIVTWLAAVRAHWRKHPDYAMLRGTLLSRLADMDEAYPVDIDAEQAKQERQVEAWRDRDRQRFASIAWANRQLADLRLMEI
jgi:hypothetical protein